MSHRITAFAGAALLGIAAMAGLSTAMDASAAASTEQQPATGTTETYTVDGGHSSLIFRIKHLNVAPFYGRFNRISGTIIHKPSDMSKSSIEITVPAGSVDTNSKGRDQHVKSAEFFDVEQFPTITFKSTRVTPINDVKCKVEGDLTFRGVTKTVSMDLELTGAGVTPFGDFRIGVETMFNFKRSDFGMTALLASGPDDTDKLSDDIRIIAGLEAIRKSE